MVKRGDGQGRNVTKELFRQKVADADVKIIAITNHNSFDLSQYIELRDAVENTCQVWPGVEIDIKQELGNKWHLVVVANPENVERFADRIMEMFNNKCLETITCTIKEVFESLNDCDVIYIAHFHKKPSISEEDREELMRIVGEPARVFNETSDHRALGVFANHGFNVLIGSDVKNWRDYEKSTFAELRLAVTSFQQFCLLAKRDSVVVETLLNKKKYNVFTASPHSTVSFDLRVYEDMNILFGQKGTGKSEILTSLYTKSKELGINSIIYRGSDKDEKFNDLLNCKAVERDLGKIQADDCEVELSELLCWVEKHPTLLNNYVAWCSTKENNANKSMMKITDSTELVELESERHQEYYSTYNEIKKILEGMRRIKLSLYLSSEEVDSLIEILGKLKHNIREKLVKSVIEIKAVELVNYSLCRIKDIADKNSSTVSKPASTGFRDYAINRLRIKHYADKILKSLRQEEHNEKKYLGEIDGKGKVFVNTKYRMLCDASKTSEYPSCGIRNLRDVHSKLFEVATSYLKIDVASLIVELSQKCKQTKISSLRDFLGVSKQIILADGTKYIPSNGERAILMLQRILESEADAYFLDEPELGMGNSYIDCNVRPILSDLAKRHKTVVVATHNANIAVRTLPYMSILRTHQNGIYGTYTGNPFDDRLININDERDIKSWTIESLHTLEGGEEAFYERKSIYETK